MYFLFCEIEIGIYFNLKKKKGEANSIFQVAIMCKIIECIINQNFIITISNIYN